MPESKKKDLTVSRNRRQPTAVERQVQNIFGMEPNLQRGTLLPFAKNPKTGKAELAAPQVLYDLARAFVAPGVVLSGQPVDLEDEASNLALNFTGAGVASRLGRAGRSALAVDRNAVGMSGGAPRRAAAKPKAEKPLAAKPKGEKPLAAKLKGEKAAAKPKRTAITKTPDLRTMSTDEAIAAARKEPHLTQDKSGQYIGAPRGATTREQIEANRKSFDADVAAGSGGADWYTRAREANKEWAGPDPARQQLISDEEALWSAQASPDTNMNFMLQGHNAYEMGSPLELVRTGQQARTYREARDAGLRVPLGKKTGVYGQHLDPTQPHATTGTNDIWHARGFGYTNNDGGLFSRALSDQEHRFLDYETMLAVDRANQAKLGGRSDWQAHEIQAAPWVAGKGRALAEQRGLTPEEGIAQASMTYPDYANKYTAFGTSERVPYVGSEHLSGIVGSDDATRAMYSADPRASWSPEGRDIIIDALGGYQRSPLEATGFYTPPGGKLEINPATITRALVGVSEGAVDPASRGMMDVAEALRGYIDAQGASAWHKPIANAKPGEMGSVFIPAEGPVSGEDLLRLRELGEPYGLTDVVDTGQGVTLTSFYPGPPSGAETGKALKGDLGVALRDVMGSPGQRVKIDSGYQPLFELEESGPGTGVVTRALEELISRYPEVVLDKLNTEAIRRRAMSGRALDEEIAQRGYGEARPDIQRARELIGAGGLRELFAALKRGEALPAAIPFGAFAVKDYQDEVEE